MILDETNFEFFMTRNIPSTSGDGTRLNHLDAQRSLITEVNYLPENLHRLMLDHNPLVKINCEFPKTLQYISVFDCFLRELPRIPEGIKDSHILVNNNCFSKAYSDFHRMAYEGSRLSSQKGVSETYKKYMKSLGGFIED